MTRRPTMTAALQAAMSFLWISAARAAPSSDPLYAEYQPPIELHNRFFVGALIICAGLMSGGLLLISGRRVSGSTISLTMSAVGLVLILSRPLHLF
jgi:hypothetical protein